ncbi:P-selectin-like [Mya arenaria]|uniref:P-selectin-like n=1 Tax=Mya arenaria TaxID=6604 RepID=UPI0022E0D2C1|nr:P-selectin-like [Mya arenaria]
MDGNETHVYRTCQPDLGWNGTEPVCIPKDCGPLSPPTNGVVSHSGGVSGNTTFGAMATYTCNYGYEQSHYLTRTCTSNSTWSSTEPLCSLIGPTTKRPNSPLYIMPCICYNNYSWTGLSQDEITQLLIRETTIQKKNTSRYLARLSCREDPRSSSTVVGVVGTAIIGGIFLMIFLADVPTLYKHIREAIRKVKGHS